MNDDGTVQPNGRGEPRLWTKILHRISPERVSHDFHRIANDGETVRAKWLTGAVVAGRRDWLSELGPWDERFFVYYEDADLGIRCELLNGRSFVLGSSRWVHGWKRATSTLDIHMWKLEVDSMAKFYRKFPRYLLPASIWRR